MTEMKMVDHLLMDFVQDQSDDTMEETGSRFNLLSNLITCRAGNKGVNCSVIPEKNEMDRNKREVNVVEQVVKRAKRGMCSPCGCPHAWRHHFGIVKKNQLFYYPKKSVLM